MAGFIVCNQCGNKIEIDAALKDQFREEERRKIIAEVQDEAEKKASAALAFQLKKAKDETGGAIEENRKLRSQLDELLTELKKAKNERDDAKLEAHKLLISEEEKIRIEAQNKAFEEQKLKFAEKDKIINDLKNAVEEARRKADQGSQQLQGEIQELDLKTRLIKSFPDDLIDDVEKGIRGADIRQTVRTKRGHVCGVILWESKRTKSWENDWLITLKDNLRNEAANIPVIVTSAMPKNITLSIGYVDSVWLVKPELAEILGLALRDKLIEVAKSKFFAQDRGNKADAAYEYLTGHEFVQQIQALAEVYKESVDQIDQEKRAFERIWKTREGQAKRLMTGAVNIYGKVQGIAGAALPAIPILELTGPE